MLVFETYTEKPYIMLATSRFSLEFKKIVENCFSFITNLLNLGIFLFFIALNYIYRLLELISSETNVDNFIYIVIKALNKVHPFAL